MRPQLAISLPPPKPTKGSIVVIPELPDQNNTLWWLEAVDDLDVQKIVTSLGEAGTWINQHPIENWLGTYNPQAVTAPSPATWMPRYYYYHYLIDGASAHQHQLVDQTVQPTAYTFASLFKVMTNQHSCMWPHFLANIYAIVGPPANVVYKSLSVGFTDYTYSTILIELAYDDPLDGDVPPRLEETITIPTGISGGLIGKGWCAFVFFYDVATRAITIYIGNGSTLYKYTATLPGTIVFSGPFSEWYGRSGSGRLWGQSRYACEADMVLNICWKTHITDQDLIDVLTRCKYKYTGVGLTYDPTDI